MFDYLATYKGTGYSNSKDLPHDRVVLLPDEECRFVILSNWTVDDTDYSPKAPAKEIYWGFGRVTHQLFPGRSTPLIPIANTRDIVVRSAPGYAGTIYYTFFK